MRMRWMMTMALGCLGLMAACDEDPYDEASQFVGPVSTNSAVTWVDQSRSEVLFVLPGDERVDVRRQPVGDDRTRISWVVPTLDRDELLALVVPASQKEEDVEERLVVFSADGSGDSRSRVSSGVNVMLPMLTAT